MARRRRFGAVPALVGAGPQVTMARATAISWRVRVFVGAPLGAPCADSYSCQGFLIGGAECVDDEGDHYCSRYCDSDADCSSGWRCGDANPTVMAIETTLVDQVCMRPR